MIDLQYERKEKVPLEDVVLHIPSGEETKVWDKALNERKKIVLGDDTVKVGSLRMKTFRFSGLTCVACGLTGSFFAKERPANGRKDAHQSWHLNLYAVDPAGIEVLMTSDHIVPLARGGSDKLHNRQTMCGPCNWAKADKLPQSV